jgi:hypothetical protein
VSGPNAGEIVVGANGKVMVASPGAALPTDVVAPWPAGWVDLGFLTEAGVKLTDGRTMAEAKAWQSTYSVRRLVASKQSKAAFTLTQWDKVTVPLAFGGGKVSVLGAGVYRYAPPAPGSVDERALGVEWADGTRVYRLVIPLGMAVDPVASDIARTKEAELPIGFEVTTPAVGQDPWFLLSSDPSLGPDVGDALFPGDDVFPSLELFPGG